MKISDQIDRLMGVAYTIQYPISPLQCPRGMCSALLLDRQLNPMAVGHNHLPPGRKPCTCNDGRDTLVAGSVTCKAIHAEAAALAYLRGTPLIGMESWLLATRPPCRKCLPLIRRSNVRTIVTTDQYPDRDSSEKGWPYAWITLPFERFKECSPS